MTMAELAIPTQRHFSRTFERFPTHFAYAIRVVLRHSRATEDGFEAAEWAIITVVAVPAEDLKTAASPLQIVSGTASMARYQFLCGLDAPPEHRD
jgi:hypothetical protein